MLGLVLMGAIASCSEVDVVGAYDNWQEKNEAYCDSLLRVAGTNLFSTPSDTAKVDAMPLGTLFAIQTRVSTTEEKQYVFCKKLTATEGRHPLYTEVVSVFYCGSYLTGDVFDSNFAGYVATDAVLDGEAKLPEVYDTPTALPVSSWIDGWVSALQYMRRGERWMFYVPYQSGYGAKPASGVNVLGYSTLMFDVILSEIAD